GKTRSVQDKINLMEIPIYDESIDLQPYLDLKNELSELQRKIELTDDLINQIVYRLYGLTDEEIQIVEESLGYEREED
ncbi:MAG: restriction endonuclease, partial [Thermoplasmata archaeon]